jgi:DNA-binding IclR family transcriptional regulator
MTRDGLSVVEKVAMVVELFLARRASALRFNEIREGSGLSKATAHRLLADMTENGLLSQDALRDEYRLGPLLLSAGAQASRAAGVPERALAAAEQLRDEFGETTLVAELHDGAAVPVRRLEGLHEMRMNQELGRRYPAYAGATGQVLLAHLEREDLAAYLDDLEIEPLTARTVRTTAELSRALDRIRRAGVGVSVGERVPEAIAVSAPVFGGDGRLACALTVSGVASRWSLERTLAAALAVQAVAERASREAGYRPADDAPTSVELGDPGSDAHAALGEQCDGVWSAAA